MLKTQQNQHKRAKLGFLKFVRNCFEGETVLKHSLLSHCWLKFVFFIIIKCNWHCRLIDTFILSARTRRIRNNHTLLVHQGKLLEDY